jgi:HlyD family secretion protein
MKRIIAIVGVIAILAVAGFFGYQQFLAPVEPTPTVEADLSAQSALPEVVSAEGFVVPDREVDLAFQAGGQVAEVLVSEGDAVQAEQVLSRLDSTDQQMAVAQARSGVAQAEAGVGQAKAALASAQAQLAQVKAGPTAEAIAQAEAGVQTAQARLNQLVAGARPEDIQSAAANLLKVQAALRQAQAAYDEIAWAGDVGDKPQAIALEQATMDYEAAQAQYERLVNGPTAEEIAVARAGITEAEAALAAVKAGPTREQIAVAEAGVAQAEAGVAEAEAALAAAQAALETAQAALDNFELVASFPGTVARVNVEVGQFLAPGASAITLGDASTWYVETDDLSEVDVVQVAVGQPVKVTVDALPDQEFQGIVTDIAPRSETKRGDVTYTVSIKLTGATDAPLRWGMTAFVDINVE